MARLAQHRVAEEADGLDRHERHRVVGTAAASAERLRVDLDADGVELAGRADPLQLAERPGQRRRPGRAGTRTTTRLSLVADGRPGRAPRRRPGAASRVRASSTAPGSPVIVASRLPAAGAPRPLGGLAGGEAGRVPAHQRLERRVGRVADRDHAPARSGPGAAALTQRRSASSSARRSTRDEQQPGVEQHDGGVAAVGHRLGARRRDHDLRARRRRSPAPPSPELVRTRVPGKARPSSSAVRASPSTGARSPRWPHSAHAQASATVPHQRQAGGVVGPVSASGPWQAAQRAGVRQRSQASDGGVAEPRGLHEHRPVLQRVADGGVHLARHPRGPGVGVAGHRRSAAPAIETVTRRRTSSRSGAELARPAGADEVLGLDGAREAAHQRRGALALGAQQQGLAGVGVGRPRLGVQVVAVVPDHHQARGRGPARSRRRGCRPRPAGRRG